MMTWAVPDAEGSPVFLVIAWLTRKSGLPDLRGQARG